MIRFCDCLTFESLTIARGYMEAEILARLAKLERLTANLTTLEASVADNSKTLSTLPGSVDTFYLITCGALIFFMQARVRVRV